jgi:hypothetical protein
VSRSPPRGLSESSTGGGGGGGHQEALTPDQIEVAVLNGTSPPVPNLASDVAQRVQAAGFKLGKVTDSPTAFETSVIMFEPDHKAEAKMLAQAIKDDLGSTPTQSMTSDIRGLAGRSNVALIVGQNNAGG